MSVNVLKLKEKYPNTKFILSIHNYQPICPLNQYFQNHNSIICDNFHDGNECLKCSVVKLDQKEYYKHARNYYYDLLSSNFKFLKLPLKLFSKLFMYRSRRYIGSESTMLPEMYLRYRTHNIQVLNKYADRILAVSDRVRQIMIEHGVDSNKIFTSYIGTKLAENELGHSVAQTTSPFTIAYMGYERIDKGFFFMIDALSKLDNEIAKNINVVLAVSNLHKKNYVEKLTNFNQVIAYKGYTHKELPAILKNVNLGIVPVLWEDNLPQVAIEMVACGVPILCSDFGGASELCKSDLFKFRGGDEDDFTEKLVKLAKNPDYLPVYWENHPPLQTMESHVNQLLQQYYV